MANKYKTIPREEKSEIELVEIPCALEILNETNNSIIDDVIFMYEKHEFDKVKNNMEIHSLPINYSNYKESPDEKIGLVKYGK